MYFDALGRTVRTIEYFIDGVVSDRFARVASLLAKREGDQFAHQFLVSHHFHLPNTRGVPSRGHASVGTTMIDTHVLNKGGRGVKSPLDK